MATSPTSALAGHIAHTHALFHRSETGRTRTLTDADIDFSPSVRQKVTGKRSKQRVVPLPPELLDEIAEWAKDPETHGIRHCPHPPLLAG